MLRFSRRWSQASFRFNSKTLFLVIIRAQKMPEWLWISFRRTVSVTKCSPCRALRWTVGLISGKTTNVIFLECKKFECLSECRGGSVQSSRTRKNFFTIKRKNNTSSPFGPNTFLFLFLIVENIFCCHDIFLWMDKQLFVHSCACLLLL